MGPVVNEMSDGEAETETSELVEDRDGEDTFLGKVQSLREDIAGSDKIRNTRGRRTVFGYTGFMEELGKESGLPEYGRVVPYRSRELNNPRDDLNDRSFIRHLL